MEKWLEATKERLCARRRYGDDELLLDLITAKRLLLLSSASFFFFLFPILLSTYIPIPSSLTKLDLPTHARNLKAFEIGFFLYTDIINCLVSRFVPTSRKKKVDWACFIKTRTFTPD